MDALRRAWGRLPRHRPTLQWVLLYHTPEAWRFSVREKPDAICCGALDLDPAATVDRAHAEMLVHLRKLYPDVPSALRWADLGNGSWSGTP